MQQLLGDKAWETDNAFIRELFMQRLPANVRMVLPSTPDMGNLDELAQLADKIMEVAIPSGPTIAAVSSTTFELEHLRKKVAELKSLLQGLRPLSNQVLDALLVQIDSRQNSSVGTTTSMVTMHRNANPPARSRETSRPRGEGDGRSWPFPQSPILYN